MYSKLRVIVKRKQSDKKTDSDQAREKQNSVSGKFFPSKFTFLWWNGTQTHTSTLAQTHTLAHADTERHTQERKENKFLKQIDYVFRFKIFDKIFLYNLFI